VSGQGASKTDPTQGVFFAVKGSTTATVIDNSTDTRVVQVVNGKLYVSRDYNPPGSGAQQSNLGTLTNGSTNPPTTSAGVVKTPVIPTGNNGRTPSSPAIALLQPTETMSMALASAILSTPALSNFSLRQNPSSMLLTAAHRKMAAPAPPSSVTVACKNG
jgi:hypothetical protein